MASESVKSARREQILSAAERLFQHYGFTKTTVADIARAADVGVGTVYLEFSSKEDIASELSSRRYRCVLEAMRAAASRSGSYAERLTAVFQVGLERIARYTGEGPHGKELIMGACTATNLAHARFRDEEQALLAEFLHAAAQSGEFEVPDPPGTARLLLRIFHSYTGCAHDQDEMRRELMAASRLLLRGLLARDSS